MWRFTAFVFDLVADDAIRPAPAAATRRHFADTSAHGGATATHARPCRGRQWRPHQQRSVSGRRAAGQHHRYCGAAVVAAMLLILSQGVAYSVADGRIPGVEISMPPSHTALSGDFHIQILSSSFPPLLLQLSRLEGDAIQTLATLPVLPEARALALNKTIVTIPCGYFSKGGQYYVLFKKQGPVLPVYNYGNGTKDEARGSVGGDGDGHHQDDEIITRVLDVRWPMPQLALTPEYVQTYPERPVSAILEFPEVVCPPVADSAPSAIPEFWLELHYCGHSLLTCDDNGHQIGDNRTNNNVQVLYSEQVRGFPGRHLLTLRCELFGLAGHYSLILRPTTPTPTISHTAAYVKNEKATKEPEAKKVLSSVDKAFYELEIQAIKARIERLQELNAETEEQNAELEESNAKFEEERAENIAVVKSELLQKDEELQELNAKLEKVKAEHIEEKIMYEQQLFEMQQHIDERREDLQAEIKDVQGRLNALEEFRMQREELVRQYEEQIKEMELKESEHKREIYSIEKKFVVGKDHLKREMTDRLLTLSMEFQDVTDARIQPPTQRIIRENIAINNDLNMLADLEVQLDREIMAFKARASFFANSVKNFEVTKNRRVRRCSTQRDIIREVQTRHAGMVQEAKKMSFMEMYIMEVKRGITEVAVLLSREQNELLILEQNVQNICKELEAKRTILDASRKYTSYLMETIINLMYNIQEQWIKPYEAFRQRGDADIEGEPSLEERMSNVLEFIMREIEQAAGAKMAARSVTSLTTFTGLYEAGDMNFTPKLVEYRSHYPVRRHAVTQCTYEDLHQHVQHMNMEVEQQDVEEVEEESEEEVISIEEESKVLFSASTSELSSSSQADWSEQFVFNVHARSIFPCETHTGVPVLFQYPSCILASGDRVRLYARLRDNVASLAPPTSLEYVAEQRVTRGQHSLYFDCDLFSERYVEYCFVYVSQAITGAVADVRMDCVPTLPVTESESGGWGAWSAWTPCSSTCIGGTRNRYRFCDSPPPRYGAKFCEGPSVETEKCGTGIGQSWECFYTNGISASDIAAEIPEVQAEVGPYCRCGCVVHLGQAKPRRLLATSSQSCPGRTFWLIQADDEYIIQFRVEQFHLPCGTQWLKVRDGRALSSALLVDLAGEPDTTPAIVNSTGPSILLEFFTDEVSTTTQFCGGGFLAHAEQLRPARNLTLVAPPVAQGIGLPISALKLTAVHIAAIFFLSGLLIATVLLGAQYAFRYRKYHIAQAEDQDSLADISASSASLPLTGAQRASSNATLLSEVISLTRLRPHLAKGRNKHSRLRESLDCGRGYEEQEVALAEEETLSASSTMTLTQQEEMTAGDVVLQTTSFTDVPDEETTTCSLPSSPQSYEEGGTLRRSSTIISSEKDRSTEKGAAADGSTGWKVDIEACRRRLSHASTVTLTNGSYSPASSVISRATIRSTNPKESKEKRNREKLLAGPGSDFSLSAGDGDLEMDYYDYNVVNASAVPGSYLGMDPAFLVWIPPLEESELILAENEEAQQYVDPGSNKESPDDEDVEEDDLLPKRLHQPHSKASPLPPNKKYKKVHPLVIVDNKISCESLNRATLEPDALTTHTKIVSIQMHDFPTKVKLGSPVRVHREKETRVEKPSSASLRSVYKDNNLDEIRFADEEDCEDELRPNICAGSDMTLLKRPLSADACNTNLSYHDANVLSTPSS